MDEYRPQIYGTEHLIFLAIYFVLVVVAMILAIKFLKTDKQKTIYIKILAGLVLINCLVCRIAVGVHDNNWTHALPYTICSMTNIVMPLVVIFGKPNMKVYQCLWYLGVVGGLGTVLYPDFIGQDSSVFAVRTISSLLHHGFAFLLCISMLAFKWFKPQLRYCYYFPMIFSGYIAFGALMIHKCNIYGSMLVNKSLLSGTPIDCWFILVVGTALIALLSLACELIRRHRAKNTPQNA